MIDVRDAAGRLAIMASMYSLAFPATNATFAEYRFPTDLWRVTTPRDAIDAHLAESGIGPLANVGEKKLGLMDLLHEPVLDAIVTSLLPSTPGLDDPALAHRYPVHGSSAGIGLLLAHLRVHLDVDEIWTLRGDYEGYGAQAAAQGITVRAGTVDDLTTGAGRTWFASTPSAIDGEPIDPEVLRAAASTNRLVVDLAYHGLAGATPIEIPEGAWAVLWSLSKPWGLFWRRVGMLLCRDEIPGAYGTRWFKDPERLIAAARVVQRHPPHAMSDRYRWTQVDAVAALGAAGVVAHPASTLLLALVHRSEVTADIWAEVAHCERWSGSGVARVCLTPLLEQLAFAS